MLDNYWRHGDLTILEEYNCQRFIWVNEELEEEQQLVIIFQVRSWVYTHVNEILFSVIMITVFNVIEDWSIAIQIFNDWYISIYE